MEKQSNLKEMIYERVFHSIISGEFHEETVISEKMLIEKYKVSKSPVREALVELCNEGILKSMPRYGYVVVQLTREDIESILKFRVTLESGTFRECIQLITEEQLENLERINQLCTNEESQNDFWKHWQNNMDFHLALISYSGNKFSHKMLEQALKVLTRAYAQFYWDKWNHIVFPTDTQDHEKIIDCIRKKDIEGAIYFLKEDISNFGM